MSEILGKIAGSVVERVLEKIGDRLDRASISRALRDVADGVDRGDVVPDALLDKARALAGSIAAARDRYQDG